MMRKRLASVVHVLRNHWKKSVFAAGCAALALNYVRLREKDKMILRSYCQIANQIGSQTTTTITPPRRVTAVVNPAAGDGKVTAAFEKTGLPLLHLAGLDVNIVRPQSADEFRAILSVLDGTEADDLLIVGGDGTISLGVSGLFDGSSGTQPTSSQISMPVGFFPGGRRNLAISRLFPKLDRDVRWQCECVMSLIHRVSRLKPVFKVEIEDKPAVYALSHIQWGPYRDVESLLKKYWYWGVLRRKFAYIWTCVKRAPEIGLLELEYSPPCSGCSRCRSKPVVKPPEWRWWHALLGAPRTPVDLEPDYNLISNPDCGRIENFCIEASDLVVTNDLASDKKRLQIRYGPRTLKRTDFIGNGFKRDANCDPLGTMSDGVTACSGGFDAQRLTVIPRMRCLNQDDRSAWNTVDVDGTGVAVNEDQTIKLTLLPKLIQLYIPEAKNSP